MGKIIILAVGTFIALLGSLGFVFGSTLSFSTDIKYVGAISTDIYLGNPHLSSTILAFHSLGDISQAHMSSLCDIESRFLTTSKNISFFEVDYSKDSDCTNGNLVMELDGKKIPQTLIKLTLKIDFSQQSLFTDFSSGDLIEISQNLGVQQKKYAIYKNYKGQDISRYFTFAQGQRKFLETIEQKNMVDRILLSRKQAYISPVPGKNISERFTKIPNSARPYRAGYTDGIHHGWDIDAPIGTDTVALDDGIIVRVVRDFTESDFSRIIYGENLSDEQKLKNLDILRGNQVWLKTMKGEVIFYSHLDSIPTDITEGIVVQRGEKLGTVGISGVPEKDYKDSHLHFEIAQNPYTLEMAGTYDFGDYMAWPWLTKGMNETQTIQAQKNIFQ